jgi:hypothetical protein
MEQGMVMPVSRSLRIVHGGVTTDPVQLLQDNAKYVPFRLNGETVSAAVEIVSCTAASTLLTIGCGCSAEDAQKIKSRARAGELVYIRPLMSFFAVQNNKSKGKSGKGQTGRKIVRGKMDPCAITFIEKPSDLDKNFVACTEIACRFEKDGRVLQEGQRLPGSGCEWAKAPVFYNSNVAGRYHLLATVWAADGRQFTCRSMIPKGPQSHQYSFGLFNKPT